MVYQIRDYNTDEITESENFHEFYRIFKKLENAKISWTVENSSRIILYSDGRYEFRSGDLEDFVQF